MLETKDMNITGNKNMKTSISELNNGNRGTLKASALQTTNMSRVGLSAHQCKRLPI